MSKKYGYEHQRTRKALLQAAYGTDCHLCGNVMLRGQDLDLDHTATGRRIGG